MGLTCAQADAKLASITTEAELRQLLSELDIISSGQRTVLSYLISPMLEALDDVGKQR